MPKRLPETPGRATSSGGGTRGSSSSSAGSAARRTAKTIKDINKPMSKASRQLAADATAARNKRMANITPREYKAAPRTSVTGKYYDSSGKLRSTPSSLYGAGRNASAPTTGRGSGTPGATTKGINTSSTPSSNSRFSLGETSSAKPSRAVRAAAKAKAKNIASINKPNSRRMKKASNAVAAENAIRTRLKNIGSMPW